MAVGVCSGDADALFRREGAERNFRDITDGLFSKKICATRNMKRKCNWKLHVAIVCSALIAGG